MKERVMDFLFKYLWIKHPRSGEPDTMLTLSVWALLSCLGKLWLNGAVLTIAGHSINFGTVDAGLIASVLTPTLVAYVARKQKDSPEKKPSKDDVNASS